MKTKVRDVMTRTVVTVSPSTPFKHIVHELARCGVSGAPVIGEQGTVVGVVSEADLMLKEERLSHDGRRAFATRRRRPERGKMNARIASEIMTVPAVTVGPDASVGDAARLMHAHRVNRLPVVDRDGKLVGIVSRGDVLAVFLRSDAELRDEIVGGVIRKTLWIDPSTLQVFVRDGVATLEGEVENEGLRRLIVELVEGVDGVVAVDDRLTSPEDGRGARTSSVTTPWALFPRSADA